MKPCPPPTFSWLTGKQRGALRQLLNCMAELDYDQVKLKAVQPQLIEQLAAVCQIDDEFHRICLELEQWVRWYRVPSYWLTFLFQLVTKQANSWFHVYSSMLYADAQVNMYDDLSISSLEVAYNAYLKLKESGFLSEETLKAVEEELRARLRAHHAFYTAWCRHFSYLDCNPLTDHPYSQKTWGILTDAFPEMSGGRPDTHKLSVIVEKCGDSDFTYYRILARRFLGSSYLGNRLLNAALEQFQLGLKEAVEAGLDTEIGHFYRLHGFALQMAGRHEQAVSRFEQAYKYESHLLCNYWQALSARELGDAHLKSILAQGMDVQEQPDSLRPALDAYREGRLRFEIHLGTLSVLPIARAVKQQMFRSYIANALQVATLLNSPPDILAELEAAGPRQATDNLAEILAARDLPGISVDEFKQSRKVFHQHLTTVPDSFEDYLAALPQEYQMRYLYMRTRIDLTSRITNAGLSDQIVRQILKLHLPGVVFLLFNIGERQSTAVLCELGSGNVFSLPLAYSAGDLQALHDDYRKELKRAEEVKEAAQDPAEVMRPALESLLDAYSELFGPVLEILVDAPCRHLKVFPRLHMNAVPLHALTIRSKRLIEYEHIQVSYGQTLGQFLQVHRRQAERDGMPLRMFLSENLPESYKGIHDALKLVYGEKNFHSMRLSRGEFLGMAVEDLTGDLFFACHGHYYPDNPAASCLAFGDVKNGVSFSDVFSILALKGCRSVTMGACESGLIHAELTAEYTGLPGAFLTHGIQYVVGSLWPVSEVATAVLMLRYFELLSTGTHTVPAALNMAQRELMAMTREQVLTWIEKYLPQYTPVLQYLKKKLGPQPYAHPYYWAGFYVAGDI